MIPSKPSSPIINWGNPLTKGLIFHLPISSVSGGTVRDVVNIRHGTLQGAEFWQNGVAGKSVRGDMTGSYVSLPAIPLSGSHTLAVLVTVKSIGIANYLRGFLARGQFGSDANGDTRINNYGSSGVPATSATSVWGFAVYTSLGFLNIYGNTVVAGNTYLIVGTFDQSTGNMKLWENGVVSATGTRSGTFTDNGRTWALGAYPNATSNTSTDSNFYGAWIWNRCLREKEILDLNINPWVMYRRQSGIVI